MAAPVNIAIRYARLPNGLVYYYQHWIPSDAKALVICVHGLGDHVGRYGATVNRFLELGCACALFDQRGHGRSEGKRGHVERFMDWVDDLASFVHFTRGEVAAETPVFVMGQSLGALVAIHYLLTHAQPLAGVITLSAALMPTIRVPAWKQRLGQRICRLMPELGIDNGIRLEDLTRDDSELEALSRDPLFHRRVTLWTGQEILHTVDLTNHLACRIHAPMLMLAGSDDSVCDPAGSVGFARALSSRERYSHVYKGMVHDLLHDIGREQVIDDIAGWIFEMIRRAAPTGKQFSLNRREQIWENVSQQQP